MDSKTVHVIVAPCLYTKEHWVWESCSKSPDVLLSRDQESAYFFTDPEDESTGTAGVRGTKGFRDGEHYWEVIFLEPPIGTSVMVGVGTKKALLHSNRYDFINLIGFDEDSWGLSYKGTLHHTGKTRKYCDAFYDRGTVIGCHLNLYSGTLRFFKNGEDLGVAFTGLGRRGEPLYPLVSSTGSQTELGLGMRYCRYLSLQEKCCAVVKNNLSCAELADRLPLPNMMKAAVRNF